MRRRDLFVIGGAMGGRGRNSPLLRCLPSEFEFEPLPGFDGFRRLAGGAVSAGAAAFLGLDTGSSAVALRAPSAPLSPCLALFGAQGWGADRVPVAIFSDFNCPYCKVLERQLIDLRDNGAPIRLIWHEMPLLGPASTRAARAVLAARFLGAEEGARRYLSTRLLRPGPTALAALAEAVDLPAERLAQEARGARVADTLLRSLDLGARLGIPGTPGTVIGRTLVIGAIKPADLRQLIALERRDPQTVCP